MLLVERQVIMMRRRQGVGSTNNVREMLNDFFKDAIFDGDHVGIASMNDDLSGFYGYMEILICKCTRGISLPHSIRPYSGSRW